MAKAATAPGAAAAEAVKKKKKIQVDVTGKVFVKATFNNVIVTITDVYGNTISWSSAGQERLQGLAEEHAVRRAGDPPRRRRKDGATTSGCGRSRCS